MEDKKRTINLKIDNQLYLHYKIKSISEKVKLNDLIIDILKNDMEK